MITVISRPVDSSTDSVGDAPMAPQTPGVEYSPTSGVAKDVGASDLNTKDGASVTAGENRLVLLGLVLSALPEVPFDDVAALLGVNAARLERMMHGDESLPRKFDERWKTIVDILGVLHSVLKPSATGRWMNTPIPGLGGLSPLKAVDKGMAADVLAVVRAYREPSFS